MKNLSALLSLILVLLASCTSGMKASKDYFDYGMVKNGVYSNKYFDCSIHIPEKWVVQSKERTEEISNQGQKMIISGADNEAVKYAMEASAVNSATLLVAYQNEEGAPVDYNPSIMVVTENLKNMPGVKNGSDYLFHVKRMLKQSPLKYHFSSEKFDNQVINEVPFYMIDVKANYADLEIKQSYYSTVRENFAFSVIISYVSEEQKKVLLNSINSITFEK